MASSNTNLLDSVVSEEVECAICLNKLDTPRILTCLHSFCEKCLGKCVQNRKDDSSQSGNSTLKCALCNEDTALPDAGVRGLRLDFRATRLVEALQEKETRELKFASPAHRCEKLEKLPRRKSRLSPTAENAARSSASAALRLMLVYEWPERTQLLTYPTCSTGK